MTKNHVIFLIFILFLLTITLGKSISQTITEPHIISSLRILEPPPYKVGQNITAAFSIKNMGAAPITFEVLTVGGRLNGICLQNKCPDFEFKTNIFLPPNVSYTYYGKLTLQFPGSYHFFTSYRTKDGRWNTAIPTLSGIANTANIVVSLPLVPQPVLPTVALPQPTTGDPCNQYYGTGYCTDYIKTKVNIPWRGDAITWLEKAKGHYKTGNDPRRGAVAVFSYATQRNARTGELEGGHVAWVEDVSPDGHSFIVSHWNWPTNDSRCNKKEDKGCLVNKCFGIRTTKEFNKNDPQLRGFIYP